MKVFKVTGEIKKPELNTPFIKEVIADKKEHAIEKVYSEIGSKHRVRRYHIKIASAEEVTEETVKNPILKKMLSEA
jgi:large subunit ribosomal protein LX